jgi:hypothetical protein
MSGCFVDGRIKKGFLCRRMSAFKEYYDEDEDDDCTCNFKIFQEIRSINLSSSIRPYVILLLSQSGSEEELFIEHLVEKLVSSSSSSSSSRSSCQ